MAETFVARAVGDRVHWVGAIDWDVRNFHGYLTSRGTTYNAFLVLAERVTLIDTVKAPFVDEMLARIASVVDPARIDCIVSNHAELDHAGGLPRTIQAVEPREVFASANGVKALKRHFGPALPVEAVEDGQTLSLGDDELTCAETRMCHWPDSMVSYLRSEGVLFSQDAFGMHLASAERFADELDPCLLDQEAAKYYANILLPLSRFVAKALDKLAALDVPLKTVAPDHGPIYRRGEDIEGILASYRRWVARRKRRKAVVIYDTMWQSTRRMARAIGEGLAAAGATVKLMSMDVCHRSDVATELLDAAALLVGSPTLNNTIFPTLADVMTYVKGLRPANLLGAAFGSYGWGGEAPKQLQAMLGEMGAETPLEPLRVQYVPDEEALAGCREFGRRVGERVARISSEP
jgi:flavorubredoxin